MCCDSLEKMPHSSMTKGFSAGECVSGLGGGGGGVSSEQSIESGTSCGLSDSRGGKDSVEGDCSGKSVESICGGEAVDNGGPIDRSCSAVAAGAGERIRRCTALSGGKWSEKREKWRGSDHGSRLV